MTTMTTKEAPNEKAGNSITDEQFTALTGLIPGKAYNAEDIPRIQEEAMAKGLMPRPPKRDVSRETKASGS
jgi:hypothetical protein